MKEEIIALLMDTFGNVDVSSLKLFIIIDALMMITYTFLLEKIKFRDWLFFFIILVVGFVAGIILLGEIQ